MKFLAPFRAYIARRVGQGSAVVFALLCGCESPGGESRSEAVEAAPSQRRSLLEPGPALRRPAARRETRAPTVPARPMARPTRGVWVARMHYRFPDDVRTIIRNCAELGMNTVYWQVRGNATVAYPSAIEPWMEQFDHRDPGFDPLALAIEEAHQRGMRLEAWVNVMPGWRTRQPPGIPNQIYNAHPEWFLYDEDGQRQPLGSTYVIVNPCLPEVRRHILGVLEEIATRYNVDGLHLDYVRFAWDGVPGAKQQFPRDPRTLSLYRRDTGKHPDDDASSWNNWRSNQITRIVQDARAMLRRKRPGASLTAAVWGSPYAGFDGYLQNAVAWARSGIVDALLPMAYTEKLDKFEADIGAYQQLAPRARIIPGVGVYKLTRADEFARQLQACRRWGGEFALYSFDSLHSTDSDRYGRSAESTPALRDMRRAVVADAE